MLHGVNLSDKAILCPVIRCAGESAMLVQFGKIIDRAVNCRVHELARRMGAMESEGIMEIVPSYCALMIFFNPLLISRDELKRKVLRELEHLSGSGGHESLCTMVPVLYGGVEGPDLQWVAQYMNLPPSKVIEKHTERPLRIYMLGFTPGFPYLEGLECPVPRLDCPRTSVSAGSVGIAGNQTGIYPVDSPGGWRIIGRTPLTIFGPGREKPFLFEAGEYIHFYAVHRHEYERIKSLECEGRYVPDKIPVGEGN